MNIHKSAFDLARGVKFVFFQIQISTAKIRIKFELHLYICKRKKKSSKLLVTTHCIAIYTFS